MLKFLMNAGATSVSMNSGDAKYAGIDYRKRECIQLQTANSTVTGYSVVTDTLKLGSVMLNQVDGTVLEGSPAVVLLGMSAPNRMENKRDRVAYFSQKILGSRVLCN